MVVPSYSKGKQSMLKSKPMVYPAKSTSGLRHSSQIDISQLSSMAPYPTLLKSSVVSHREPCLGRYCFSFT